MKYLIILFVFILSSCSSTRSPSEENSFPTPIGGEIPEKEKLFQSMRGIYKAEIRSDWKTFWSYFSPSEQKNRPLGKFLQEMKEAHHSIEYKILSVTNEGEDKENEFESTVEVKIQWITKEKNGYGLDVLKDYWIFSNGQWYWIIRN